MRGKKSTLNPSQEARLVECSAMAGYITTELADLVHIAGSTVYCAIARAETE